MTSFFSRPLVHKIRCLQSEMLGFTCKFSIHDLALTSKAPISRTLFSYMKNNHEHASLNNFTYTTQILHCTQISDY